MNGSPAFSVIIPVHDKWNLTADALRSLHEHTQEYAYEVIVVDNGSRDETADNLRPLGMSLFGKAFRRMRFEENRNFGPACNVGAKVAATPLLFFLNNDTLCTPGWAPPLLDELAADPSLGGVGPLLLFENRTIQHCGIYFDRANVGHLYRHFPADHPAARKKRRFQAITAAALMMPRTLFLEHGGFYEDYRNGFEDVDLCLRIGRSGKRFTCRPDSVVFHLESRTPSRHGQNDYNSRLLTRRCRGLFRPDSHLHLSRDGFHVFIDDLLVVAPRLTPEDEEALTGACRDQPLSVWQERCREHPWWVRGREVLVAALEQAGSDAAALLLRAELADILRDVGSTRHVLLRAKRLGNAEIEALAEKRLAACLALGKDAARCREIMRQAEKLGDERLCALYAEKLRGMES
jgi:GT2 family glycosyltransferase